MDYNVFHKAKTVADFNREAEEHALRRQMLQQRSMGQTPAAVQIANEIAKARASGDTQRLNDIVQSAKLFDRGVVQDANGNPMAMGGYGDAVGSIAGDVAGAKQLAVKNVDLIANPQIAGLEKQAQLAAEAGSVQNKKGVQANDVMSILDEADPLLNDATGSTIGAGVAAGKKIFGKSDKSTQANAALSVLEGRLISNIPRMEGPQSDKDVELYRKQAAKLSDPSVPADDKRAAIAAIRAINSKYTTNPIAAVLPDMPLLPGTKQASPSSSSAPKPGSLVDGYMFTGGHPGKQSNWKKVQ
ncbi:hypothetical protein LZD49_33475 [Dyadobacter sp. CY261]|uniref:hypothetical protein n=1 Tax=Dyadobacter sp. CY261 TaxID=2907203 RepID=UPI001F2AF3E6|nr:hypothetical protein [Dyadobacter sp. CY261]MCF0075438.1 hypothetical protein [Dyadobacter sp. CY261]